MSAEAEGRGREGERKRTGNGKLVALLVVGFGVFHCASLLLGMLPHDWAVNSVLAPYRQVTGTEQNWRMFQTIPRVDRREVTLAIVDGSGAVVTKGPVLPGLERFDLDKRIRYERLVDRLISPENPYKGHFIDALGKAISSSPDLSSPSSFELRVDTHYIRLLKRIEEDGEMSLLKSQSFGPFMVEGEE
ncbi:MAG: hypothetical protein ACI9MB_003456 [Verrucomicrobiales bacterium]|jgi:hypothetical protein